MLTPKGDVLISSAAMLLLIEKKLTTLRRQRRNSPEALEEIEPIEVLQKQVEELRASAQRFADGVVKESAVVKSTISLAEGLKSWWTRRHLQICDKAYDLGLFGVGVGLCCLAGASGVVSSVVAGTLVRGKPVVDAIRAIGKSFPRGGSEPTNGD